MDGHPPSESAPAVQTSLSVASTGLSVGALPVLVSSQAAQHQGPLPVSSHPPLISAVAPAATVSLPIGAGGQNTVPLTVAQLPPVLAQPAHHTVSGFVTGAHTSQPQINQSQIPQIPPASTTTASTDCGAGSTSSSTERTTGAIGGTVNDNSASTIGASGIANGESANASSADSANTASDPLLGRQEAKYPPRPLLSKNQVQQFLSQIDSNLVLEEDAEDLLDNLAEPDVVVHAAAERRPDVVEKSPQAVEALNVSATQALCEAAESAGAYLVYISTDYVFDGTSAPYGEEAAPHPLNAYGTSKLEGEKVVAKYPKFAILRVPILYGPVESLDESAVTTLAKCLRSSGRQAQGDMISMDNYQRRYPTHVDDVAKACETLATAATTATQPPEGSGATGGVFHWSCDEMLTKYAMLAAMVEGLGALAPEGALARVVRVDSAPQGGAPRPYDCQLECTRLEALGMKQRTKFSDAIVECIHRFV